MGHYIGTGCTTRNDGLPEHNPKPSTPRGKKRVAECNEDQRKRKERAWETSRSNRPSKKQQELNSNGANNRGK